MIKVKTFLSVFAVVILRIKTVKHSIVFKANERLHQNKCIDPDKEILLA